MSQILETQNVACPKCKTNVEIPVSDIGIELKVSPYVLAFGDHVEVECPDEHVFWVYYC